VERGLPGTREYADRGGKGTGVTVKNESPGNQSSKLDLGGRTKGGRTSVSHQVGFHVPGGGTVLPVLRGKRINKPCRRGDERAKKMHVKEKRKHRAKACRTCQWSNVGRGRRPEKPPLQQLTKDRAVVCAQASSAQGEYLRSSLREREQNTWPRKKLGKTRLSGGEHDRPLVPRKGPGPKRRNTSEAGGKLQGKGVFLPRKGVNGKKSQSLWEPMQEGGHIFKRKKKRKGRSCP